MDIDVPIVTYAKADAPMTAATRRSEPLDWSGRCTLG